MHFPVALLDRSLNEPTAAVGLAWVQRCQLPSHCIFGSLKLCSPRPHKCSGAITVNDIAPLPFAHQVSSRGQSACAREEIVESSAIIAAVVALDVAA
jgi:hypothetical protein